MARGALTDPMLPYKGRQCLCGQCLRYFSSESAFSAHRQAKTPKGQRSKPSTGECYDPAERGLVLNDGGYWQAPGPDDRPTHWSAHTSADTRSITHEDAELALEQGALI